MHNVDPWHDVFLTLAGAGATLAGLIIVAMSVNIEFILKIRAMPARAGATIGSLVLVVVVTILALVPNQSNTTLGVCILALTLISAALHTESSIRMMQSAHSGMIRQTLLKIALAMMQVAPFLVAGVLLLLRAEAGLLWIVIGSLTVFVGAIVNAWVLLVEIRR